LRPQRNHCRYDQDTPIYDHVRTYYQPDGSLRGASDRQGCSRGNEARI